MQRFWENSIERVVYAMIWMIISQPELLLSRCFSEVIWSFKNTAAYFFWGWNQIIKEKKSGRGLISHQLYDEDPFSTNQRRHWTHHCFSAVLRCWDHHPAVLMWRLFEKQSLGKSLFKGDNWLSCPHLLRQSVCNITNSNFPLNSPEIRQVRAGDLMWVT